MLMYRFLFAFNALVILVLGFFFITGLQYDGGGESMSLWLPILLVPTVGVVGAWALRANGRNGLAVMLLAAIAILPASLVAFYGFLFATGASWQ